MQMSIRGRRLATMAIGIAVSFHAGWAQRVGTPPPAGTGNTTGTPPSRTIPGGRGPIDRTPADSMNVDLYLTGRVMLDDGTPPPEQVKIERVCNGVPRAQAYTDKKGQFSFQIGRTTAVPQDAGEQAGNIPGAPTMPTSIASITDQAPQPNTPDTRLSACDLRAVLAGYHSDIITLGGRRLMDDPSVGTIVLHRLGTVEGTSVSVTSLQAPGDARKAYNKARQHIRKDKLAEAEKELRKAVALYPKFAEAWNELGRIQALDKQTDQARQSFEKALAADSKFISPYFQLIEMAAKAENWTELAERTEKLIKIDPVDYPMAYFYSAAAQLNLGRLEIAEQNARQGARLDPQHRFPKLEEVLAVVLQRKKDYAGAVEHMRAYLALAPDADDAPPMRSRLAELERLAGKDQRAQAADREAPRKEPE